MFERHIETQEYLHIPLSAKMYSIDISGKIKNTEDEIVETTLDADGDLTAWLSLWDGCRYYKVAILVALTFKPIRVPFTYWKLLTVLFKDSDKLNLHPSNLVWKFPVGLESKRFPGHAFIPCFTRYVISREGVIKRFMDGSTVSIYKNGKGYCIASLKSDVGKTRNIGRHRAVVLAWLDYPSEVDSLHTNHIDGIPGNDDLDNLELVTPKQNVYHALRTGLRIDGKEILVRNIETEEITSFYTEADACRALGFYRGAIRTVTNISLDMRKPYMGYDVRLARERMFWEDLDLSKHQDVLESSEGKIGTEDLYAHGLRDDARPVLTRNVLTGVVTEHISLARCARFLDTGIVNVYRHLTRGRQLIYPGYVQYKEKSDVSPWIIPTEKQIRIFQRDQNEVILIRNVDTGKVRWRKGIQNAAETLGVSYDHLHYRLRTPGQQVWPGYIQVQKKSNFTEWREPDNLEEEHRIAVHGRAVLSRNVLTGEVKEYVSARACAFDLGFSELTIAVRLREPGQKVYPGNMQFKHKHDDTPWREIGDTRDELSRRSYPIPVRIRDIYTDQRWEFESLADACIELNIPMHALMKRKDKVNSKPYLNFEFRFNGDEFSNYTQEDLELFKQCIEDSIPFRGRGYRVLNTQTGKEAVFANVNRLIKEIPISQPHLSSLSINGNVYQKKWRFSYYFN